MILRVEESCSVVSRSPYLTLVEWWNSTNNAMALQINTKYIFPLEACTSAAPWTLEYRDQSAEDERPSERGVY